MPPRRTRKKYGREIPQVSQKKVTDSKTGKSVREVSPLLTLIFPVLSFGVGHLSALRNRQRNHVVKLSSGSFNV